LDACMHACMPSNRMQIPIPCMHAVESHANTHIYRACMPSNRMQIPIHTVHTHTCSAYGSHARHGCLCDFCLPIRLRDVRFILRDVSLELRDVSLELRDVSLELRNVRLELRNVSLELRNVRFQARRQGSQCCRARRLPVQL
jgi:hypothetical protein